MELLIEQQEGDYVISTDKRRLDQPYIRKFLSEKSYWALGIPLEVVNKSIENSCCFGVYHNGKQIGFARMVTDYATFAYLADVFIDEGHRGKGLSKMLMKFIFNLEEFKGLRRILLGTRDAQDLYSQYGFKLLGAPERFMELHRPDVYKRKV